MKKITVERIERAIQIVAVLIDKHGMDHYWPILERLESERDLLLARRAKLKRYVAEANAVHANSVRRQGNDRGS